jgi:uroporphyrinogen-III synthase
LIERHGGIPYLAPCLREAPAEDRALLKEALELVAGQPIHMAIFQTGVGTASLFAAAAELGQDRALRDRLAAAIVVERGPKPLSVLLKHGVRIDRRTVEPHTTAEVMALIEEDLSGRMVLLQHYGVRNTALVTFLAARGANVLEVTTYNWALPHDLAPVLAFIRDLAHGRIDITTFTSASQVQNLFEIADEDGSATQLADWLRDRTVVAAIGPTTAQALAEHGITVRVQPERPKMVPLVRALCEHIRAPRPHGPG